MTATGTEAVSLAQLKYVANSFPNIGMAFQAGDTLYCDYFEYSRNFTYLPPRFSGASSESSGTGINGFYLRLVTDKLIPSNLTLELADESQPAFTGICTWSSWWDWDNGALQTEIGSIAASNFQTITPEITGVNTVEIRCYYGSAIYDSTNSSLIKRLFAPYLRIYPYGLNLVFKEAE